MSTYDIKRLRDLEARATKGEWESRIVDPNTSDVYCEKGSQIAIGLLDDDASLIAATRNCLPALLDDLERGNRALEMLREIEWSCEDIRGDFRCPCCDGFAPYTEGIEDTRGVKTGHLTHCELAALLGEGAK